MKPLQALVHVMLAGMLLIPVAYLLEPTIQAAPAPSSVRNDLLLTRLPTAPLFDAIHKLARPVIATYIVKGREDLWSICKRFRVDQFTVRTSNGWDVSVFTDDRS